MIAHHPAGQVFHAGVLALPESARPPGPSRRRSRPGGAPPGRRCRAAAPTGRAGRRSRSVRRASRCTASGNERPSCRQLDPAVRMGQDARRVARAAVGQPARALVEDAAEDRAAEGAGDQGGEAVHGGQGLRRAGVLQQQGPAGAAQLAHHGRGLEAVPDTVADHDADPPVGQFDEVVPVAPHLQRAAGRFVAGREARGQPGRPEDGALQGQGGFPLLIRWWARCSAWPRYPHSRANSVRSSAVNGRAGSTSIQTASSPSGCSMLMPDVR